MNTPDINILCAELEKLLEGFKPTTMHYLDDQGNWLEHPRKVRDRVSNELWFRIWEAKQEDDYHEQINNLLSPFLRDEDSWHITRKIFERLLNNTSTTNSLLIILEVLYRLIEHDANQRNSKIYTGDYDYKGKVSQMEYVMKTQKFTNRIHKLLSDKTQVENFSKIINLLKYGKKDTNHEAILLKSIFSNVSYIIAQEEKIRQAMSDLIARLKDSRKRNESHAIISEDLGPALGTLTRAPQALVRPCLELLFNKDIAISSGLPFEASSILGALKDSRCFSALLEIFKNCHLKYANLRCNLIYAIGNRRQKESLKYLVDVLEEAESVDVYHNNGSMGYKQSLNWEKYEAIWALGKLESDAIEAVPSLTKYVNSKDINIQRALAWAMARIGNDQKQKFGGMDASIVMVLMSLLTRNDTRALEETIYSLRKLKLPNFLHSLYLHNIKTIPVLSLKPSNTGLYELSETLFHLLPVKKPVVMAVTGDSGTGKTYFCEAIKNGFGSVQKNEILYLMRDNLRHVLIFDRMLGIKLLKELLDPEQYQNYLHTKYDDNPDAFFEDFIKKHSGKKLIILDGWMDESYFYHVIKTFYRKGYLDIIVNFRTAFSTKRLNLEEREGLLENVKTCLSYVEKPLIEDTEFYRNGDVLVYNLDNSAESRLNEDEITEVFTRQKVETWGDYIRVGNFEKDNKPLKINKECLSSSSEKYSCDNEFFSFANTSYFSPREANFSRILNEDTEKKPNLLQIVKVENTSINHIAFYTQGQIAFCGYDGSIGILIGLNDQVFCTDVHNKKAMGLCVVGGDICSFDVDGTLEITSFGKNTITHLASIDSPVSSITSDRSGRIVTGHMNGAVRIWDIQSREVKIVKGHTGPVLAVAVDRSGRICSGGRDKEVRLWDVATNRVKIFVGHESPIKVLGFYPDGRIVTGTGFSDMSKAASSGKIRIIDEETNVCDVFHAFDYESVDAMNIYFDGRIIVGLTAPHHRDSVSELVILDPRSDSSSYTVLTGHGSEIRDCLPMGPRIITCGSEDNSKQTLRIWGTQRYVKTELNKLKLMEETNVKPPYYHTLF